MIARFSYKQNKTTSGDVCVFTKLAGSEEITEFLIEPFDCSVPGMQAGTGGGPPPPPPPPPPPLGPILYVDDSATEAENGEDWCNAFTDLQDALDMVLVGELIYVAQGAYRPGTPFAPRTNSFVLKNGVRILGGFEGGCGNPDADNRDPDVNVTTLDGDLNADDDADFTVLSQPEFVYTNNTTLMGISGGPPVVFIDDGSLRIDFSLPLVPISNPGDFCGPGTPWNDPPFTEPLGNPTLLDTNGGIESVTLTFTSAQPVKTFGVEARHSLCTPQNFTVEFWNGAQLLGTVSRDIVSARLFVASTVDESFTHVVLSTAMSGDFSFTRVRYSFAPLDFSKEENSYHVVDGSGTIGSAFFEGFTVTAGFASGGGSDGCGGGIYVGDGSPTIQDCTFSDNFTPLRGGGMCIEGGSPTVNDCQFLWNTADDGGSPATGRGGAVQIQSPGGSPVFTGCLFDQNSAGFLGGAVNVNPGTPLFSGCTFTANSAVEGGGLWILSSATTTVIDSTFEGNSAGSGGGIAVAGGAIVLTGSTIRGNTATQFGAGLFNQSNTTSELTNCLFTGNTVKAAISNLGTAINITNCTIWANQPNGVFGLVDMFNSIAWGNGTGSESSQVQVLGGSNVLFSCIEGCDEFCLLEPSNIGTDPAFADRNGPDGMPGNEDDDLRPRAGSPANDAGDSTEVPVGIETDLDGNARFADDPAAVPTGVPLPAGDPDVIADMGAYEFQGISSCPADLNDDGIVDPIDLATLLGSWGPNAGSRADFNEDGIVGPFDLATLLGAWGPCDVACGVSGDCCDVHAGTGCEDTACCASVCELDPFCCAEQWDATCAMASWTACMICDSNCCVAHTGSGCDNSICEDLVCAVNTACCDLQQGEWFPICVFWAGQLCEELCSQ